MNERQRLVGKEIMNTLTGMGLTPSEVVHALEQLLEAAREANEEYKNRTHH